MTVFKNIIFTFVVPGTVTVLIPYWLLTPSYTRFSFDLGLFRYGSVLFMLLGIALYFWCLWHFTFSGRGMPAPIDPTEELVVQGPYRVVRNPMYLAVLAVLLGEVVLFEAPVLITYTVIWVAIVFSVVLVYEEPALRRQFGDTYRRYCAEAPRWIPWKWLFRGKNITE